MRILSRVDAWYHLIEVCGAVVVLLMLFAADAVDVETLQHGRHLPHQAIFTAPVSSSLFISNLLVVLEASKPRLLCRSGTSLFNMRWRRGVVVTELVVSTKLLYAEQG